MKRVMVFGTFDILHPGHIHFLKAAKKCGDVLIVSLARQSNIRRIKGRSAQHSEKARKAMLASLRFVDKVVLGAENDYIGHIVKQKPDIIALGYDQYHYTKGLKQRLAEEGLDVRIVRVNAYKPRIYKTQILYAKR